MAHLAQLGGVLAGLAALGSIASMGLLPRRRGAAAIAGLALGLTACGARSTLEPGDAPASSGEGGAAQTSSTTTTTAATSTTSSSASTGGGGGAPPTCLEPVEAYSLAIPESGAVVDPASVVDGDGNVYVLAIYSGAPELGPSATADPGEEGMLLARIDPCGEPTWIIPMRGATLGTTEGGVLAGDRVIFAGHLGGEIDFGTGPISASGGTIGFVVAFSLEGEALWTRTFETFAPGQLAAVRAIAADDGTVYVTGGFEGTVDFGDAVRTSLGDQDIFFARLDTSTGQTVWSAAYGTPAYEEGLTLAVTSAGAICAGTEGSSKTQWMGPFPSSAALVTLAPEDGSTSSELSLATGTPSAMTAAGEDCIALGGYTGALYLGSISLPTAVDGWNGFAARVGPDGAVRWARPFGPGFGLLSATTADASSVVVGGTLMGGWTFEDGTVLGDDVTAANVLYLLSLDLESGAFASGRTFSGAISHGVRSLTSSWDGSLFVTGVVEGTGLELGQGPLGVEGEQAIFAAKLDWVDVE